MKIEKIFHSNQYIATFSVESWHHGLRLDQFIQTYLNTLSRELIKRKIRKGEIVISGRLPPHRPSTKVHFKEIVTVTTHMKDEDPELWNTGPIPLNEPPTLVFEDEKILAVSKPAFMVTHPTGRRLFYCATVFYQSIYNQTIHSIHRLDRETSGILILGRSPQAAQEYTTFFENRMVQKCYFLIAKINQQKRKEKEESEGRTFPFWAKERLSLPAGLNFNQTRSDDPIFLTEEEMESKSRVYVHAFPENSQHGKKASTLFDLLLEVDGYAFMLAFPKTGRQHQIRAHAAYHGYPLLGDKLYNGDPSVFIRFKDKKPTSSDYELMEIPRQALHALAINLPYISANQKFSFKRNRMTSLHPQNMQKVQNDHSEHSEHSVSENQSAQDQVQVQYQTFTCPIPTDLKQWMKDKLQFTDEKILDLDKQIEEKTHFYFQQFLSSADQKLCSNKKHKNQVDEIA